MLYEAREALNTAQRIIRNKHAAAATGTQQPCDLLPVFRLMKFLQRRITAKNDQLVGLKKTVHDLFAYTLRAKGLNLDGNPRKKNALIDFLCCLPETANQTMTKKNLITPFAEAGMIDTEHQVFPTFDGLLGTCKRWVAADSNLSLP